MTPVLLNIFTTLGNNLYKALIVEDRGRRRRLLGGSTPLLRPPSQAHSLGHVRRAFTLRGSLGDRGSTATYSCSSVCTVLCSHYTVVRSVCQPLQADDCQKRKRKVYW